MNLIESQETLDLQLNKNQEKPMTSNNKRRLERGASNKTPNREKQANLQSQDRYQKNDYTPFQKISDSKQQKSIKQSFSQRKDLNDLQNNEDKKFKEEKVQEVFTKLRQPIEFINYLEKENEESVQNENKNNEFQKKMYEIQQIYQALETENEQMKKQVQERNQNNERLIEEQNLLKEHNIKIQKKLKESISEIQKSQAQLLKLQDQLDQSQQIQEDLKNQIAEQESQSKKDINQLKNQIEEYQSKLSLQQELKKQKDQELKKLQNQKNQIEKKNNQELQAQKLKLQALELDKSNLQTNIKHLEDENFRLKNSLQQNFNYKFIFPRKQLSNYFDEHSQNEHINNTIQQLQEDFD